MSDPTAGEPCTTSQEAGQSAVEPPPTAPPPVGSVDDPVAVALRMRASDADRDKVAGLLGEAFAEGRLTPVEHSERLAEVYRAQSYGDLVPTLRDLPVPAGTLPVPASASPVTIARPAAESGVPAVHPDLAGTGDGAAVAIFSAFERTGDWVVPDHLAATCVFGGGTLDLSEARLTTAETVITVVCLFGGVEVTVPDGMAVRSEVIGVFGGTEVPKDPAPAGAPTLVLKGAAIFGGVEVKRISKRRKKFRR